MVIANATAWQNSHSCMFRLWRCLGKRTAMCCLHRRVSSNYNVLPASPCVIELRCAACIAGHAGYSAGFLAAVALAVAISVAASVPARGWDPLGRWVTWGEVPAIYDSNVLSQVCRSITASCAMHSLLCCVYPPWLCMTFYEAAYKLPCVMCILLCRTHDCLCRI
jgi:hypothetical protein